MKKLLGDEAVEVFNVTRPIYVPETRILVNVEWKHNKSVRFTWVEKDFLPDKLQEIHLTSEDMVLLWRLRQKLDSEYSQPGQDIVLKAYIQKPQRRLTTFEWDFKTGYAMLAIQYLKAGEKQDVTYQGVLGDFSKFFDINQFTRIFVSDAIQAIEKESLKHERIVRKLNLEKLDKSKAAFTSRSPSNDIRDSLKEAMDAVGNDAMGLEGVFVWLRQEDKPSRNIITKIVRKNQNIEILTQQNEEDVRHVLSRIRDYCS